MKYINILICAMFLSMGIGYAQEYSTSVELVENGENMVTLYSIGLAPKKKDAKENAIKSVFYTLFTIGVDGINEGLPLINGSNSYYQNKFMNQRYIMFVQSAEEDGDAEKVGKNYKSKMKVVVRLASLIRDLRAEKLFNEPVGAKDMEAVDEVSQLPSIMVVPYKKTNETYIGLIQNDPVKRSVVVSVQESFARLGIQTYDYEAQYNATMEDKEMNVGKVALSNETKVMQRTNADVFVTVDVETNTTTAGTRVKLNLKAYDTKTSGILSTVGLESRPLSMSVAEICDHLATLNNLNDFLTVLSKRFYKDKIAKNANEVELRIKKGRTAKIGLNSVVAGKILRSHITSWVKSHAQGGRYRLEGSTDEELWMKSVRIPAQDANGNPVYASEWCDELTNYIINTLGIASEVTLNGAALTIIIK